MYSGSLGKTIRQTDKQAGGQAQRELVERTKNIYD